MSLEKIGLTKEEILNKYTTNLQLTVNDLAEIIEANNKKVLEDLKVNEENSFEEMKNQIFLLSHEN
jgi:hypothetical protein